jgi:hypothetical protein
MNNHISSRVHGISGNADSSESDSMLSSLTPLLNCRVLSIIPIEYTI